MSEERLIEILKSGGVAVLRTDTLYGIVARADDEVAVNRIYNIKQRSLDKALIVLIAEPNHAYDSQGVIAKCTDYQTPTSVIVYSLNAPDWIRHVDDTVAYRVPCNYELRQLLELTGPLVAPSANPEGGQPARNIQMAKDYFGKLVDIYVDGGEVPVDMPASRIIRLHDDGSIEQLR